MSNPSTERFLAALNDLIGSGLRLVSAARPNQHGTLVPYGPLQAWLAQGENRFRSFLGDDHIYTRRFAALVEIGSVGVDIPETGVAICEAVREDVRLGLLGEARALMAAEIFADFLEMAAHLLDEGYKDPAAMLIGAVLEDGLRKLLLKEDPSATVPENLNNLNQACYKARAYQKLEMANVQAWAQIRNSAAHGKFGEYREDQVRGMLQGVRQFLAAHPA